jgi:hypothetical protein
MSKIPTKSNIYQVKINKNALAIPHLKPLIASTSSTDEKWIATGEQQQALFVPQKISEIYRLFLIEIRKQSPLIAIISPFQKRVVSRVARDWGYFASTWSIFAG